MSSYQKMLENTQIFNDMALLTKNNYIYNYKWLYLVNEQ